MPATRLDPDREIRGDEPAPRASREDSGARARRRGEPSRQPRGGGLEGGNDARRERGDERQNRREGDDATVDGGIVEPRKGDGGEPHEGRLQERGEPETEGPSGGAENEALDDELTDEAAAARAERAADGHLPGAGDSASEHEVGEVGAGRKEHEADGAEKDEERNPGAVGQLIPERRDGDLRRRVVARILRGQSPANAIEVRLRLRDRDARGESADGFQVLTAPTGQGNPRR